MKKGKNEASYIEVRGEQRIKGVIVRDLLLLEGNWGVRQRATEEKKARAREINQFIATESLFMGFISGKLLIELYLKTYYRISSIDSSRRYQ